MPFASVLDGDLFGVDARLFDGFADVFQHGSTLDFVAQFAQLFDEFNGADGTCTMVVDQRYKPQQQQVHVFDFFRLDCLGSVAQPVDEGSKVGSGLVMVVPW